MHGANRWSHSSRDWKTLDLLERIVSKFALSAVKEICLLRLSAYGTESYTKIPRDGSRMLYPNKEIQVCLQVKLLSKKQTDH